MVKSQIITRAISWTKMSLSKTAAIFQLTRYRSVLPPPRWFLGWSALNWGEALRGVVFDLCCLGGWTLDRHTDQKGQSSCPVSHPGEQFKKRYRSWYEGIHLSCHSTPPSDRRQDQFGRGAWLKQGHWLFMLTPANTNHFYNICTMLDQRQRRWTDFVQMLYKCFVFHANIFIYSVHVCTRIQHSPATLSAPKILS